MNTLLVSIAILCLTTTGLIFLLKKIRQPYLIAYIIAGILLGPYVLKVFTETQQIEVIGEIGILLLMFFLGMEINIPNHHSLIVRPLIAQACKIILSFAFAFLAGYFLHLDIRSMVLMAFLFIFNSTAVVSEFLKKDRMLNTSFGMMILNILIIQDLLLAPVLTVLKVWKGEHFDLLNLVLPVLLCIVIFFIFRKIRNTQEIKIPKIFRGIEYDHDLQVFTGLLICLGFGILAEAIGLSGALGSFLAGVLVGRIKIFSWLEHSLTPFKVFFITVFFVSVGLRLDLAYLYGHYGLVITGTLVVLLSNSVMSALVFRFLKFDRRSSWYGGALLAQTGEFGILALSVAYKAGIIPYDLFKAGLCITCLSLLLSTIWISVFKKLTDKKIIDH
ncbi:MULTISPECIES: cation:proton antiporter [Chryseobacterium]|uniref:CPA2 family monovalent cation:H+ antiporter-2 n=1 Tax=Chryseobacterium camelliae TaxID=1265445 RepID=A0ABU0TES4_9FLAO|nr:MULTISPECIES: cation:proton antiporter [Chryseobacterium]MDT3406643.1 CPA2 family monovalent cation:H+ antiporter-2 [Pseudacidovorax intermedius]MDQ1095560.1 CPA2 family monovalent cation:H+ antiporter-2 [Chryseobacterium camelliae]MDQ1099497.1 CPA2 family monovalent cation:H+ antiporter-2 [Chryseobacterium sp. SORGH_AS_1048]MDR6086844.1 CPA2 family monovalent cation:H+ antiporter-2 [Chryseobacterium sp. SORGH_AS_0909]MDR6131215.1 CPA2 family monovalent cation:H+ antiporter-2 [Chryseobacter